MAKNRSKIRQVGLKPITKIYGLSLGIRKQPLGIKGENMKKKLMYSTLSVVLMVCCSAAFFTSKGHSQQHQAHWSYTGKTSPEHWGDLSDDYKAAKDGKEQSPINITGAKDVDLPDLELSSKKSKAEEENNGHTIEVKVENAKNTLTFK